MAKQIVLVLALVGAALPAVGAQAAPATQAEADRLKTVFERYLGHPVPGEAASVTVTPEGDTYRASFDLKQMAKPLDSFGVAIEPATTTMILTPNDNGTWRVASDAIPPIVIHLKDQTLTIGTSSYKSEGTFDPKIAAFITGTATQDGSTLDQEAPALTQHRRIGHVSASQTATPAENGSATVAGTYSFSDLTDQLSMRAPPPKASVEVAPSTPPVEFSYTIPSGSAAISVDKLRTTNLLDLWAFFVAHPNRDAIAASQDELRGLLRAALPALAGLKESASVDSLAITTQIGAFSTRKLTSSLELAELAGAGKAAMAVTIDGLTVPSADLPLWSVGLIPTFVDLRPSVAGFHFDEAAKKAVEDFDLKGDGFTPAQRDDLAHIVWPGDGKVTLAPSRITSGLLDLKLDGEATVGAGVPTGRLTVTGTGLDKAIAALQQAIATDPTAAQVLAQFVAAKNLAKPNPDGSLTWVLQAAGDSGVTVNDVPLK